MTWWAGAGPGRGDRGNVRSDDAGIAAARCVSSRAGGVAEKSSRESIV
jgi:hypothetical protein